jgi:hypothetical protein
MTKREVLTAKFVLLLGPNTSNQLWPMAANKNMKKPAIRGSGIYLAAPTEGDHWQSIEINCEHRG